MARLFRAVVSIGGSFSRCNTALKWQNYCQLMDYLITIFFSERFIVSVATILHGYESEFYFCFVFFFFFLHRFVRIPWCTYYTILSSSLRNLYLNVIFLQAPPLKEHTVMKNATKINKQLFIVKIYININKRPNLFLDY